MSVVENVCYGSFIENPKMFVNPFKVTYKIQKYNFWTTRQTNETKHTPTSLCFPIDRN